MTRRNKKIIIFSVLIIYILFLISFFYFISPEEMVNKVGVHNVYIIAFFVSLFGGFSAGGFVSFITVLVTLVAAGVNVVYLALVAGVSLAIGDMIMFYIGCKGRSLLKGKWDTRVNKVSEIFERRKYLEKIVPLISYFYIAFTPLPNDILILFLAAIKYTPKRMNMIIILGDITFAILITTLAKKGITIFI